MCADIVYIIIYNIWYIVCVLYGLWYNMEGGGRKEGRGWRKVGVRKEGRGWRK